MVKLPEDVWQEFLNLTIDTSVLIITGLMTHDIDSIESLIMRDAIPGTTRMVTRYELNDTQRKLTLQFVNLMTDGLRIVRGMKELEAHNA